MTYTIPAARLERAADLLASSSDYRVLRRLSPPHQKIEGNCPPDGTVCVAVLDCETTSLSPYSGKIIELAIALVFMSPDGEIVAHLGPWNWLEDPQHSLSAETTAITGITDTDVSGQAIDDEKATSLLDRADWIVAHHACFDAQWIDQRYPQFAQKRWACSMSELPWRDFGCEGRGLQSLLWQHGLFSNAHRAGDDVWALVNLLACKPRGFEKDTAPTYLARLIAMASVPSVRVAAIGSPYAAKDMLRERGYRWNSVERVWAKLIAEVDLASEQAWFRAEALPEPQTSRVDAISRHR